MVAAEAELVRVACLRGKLRRTQWTQVLLFEQIIRLNRSVAKKIKLNLFKSVKIPPMTLKRKKMILRSLREK